MIRVRTLRSVNCLILAFHKWRSPSDSGTWCWRILDRTQCGDRPVRLHYAALQRAVVFFETIQKQCLDLRLIRRRRQFALRIRPFQVRLLARCPLPEPLLGPRAAADRLEPLVVALKV